VFQDVPDALKTPELCLVAVQNEGEALEYVPEALKTPELCLAAVQNDGKALQYVPAVNMQISILILFNSFIYL
jgi:hypothetical protein